MNLSTARQSPARLHEAIIGQAFGVTELNDPRIVHHDEIKHRRLKLGRADPGPERRFICPGCAHEHGQKFIISGQPDDGLQRDLLDCLLRKRHFYLIPKPFLNQ